MFLKALIFSVIFLIGCNKSSNIKKSFFINKQQIEKTIYNWHSLIKIASNKYHVDEKLIKSIIYAESSGNPYAISTSNAIGLMQIKPSAAGLDIYRLYGKKRQPSVRELLDPKININIGTYYIHLLQKKNYLVLKIKK